MDKVTDKAKAGAASLADQYADLFSFAFGLRGAQDVGESESIRRRLVEQLDKADERAREAGFDPRQVEAAKFPVVALLDEAILGSKWPGRTGWMGNPLQRQLFNMNIAGEEFFNRLETLRADIAANRQVLEVYYACLAIGFEGRYKILGREKLETMMRDLSRDLGEGRAAGLDRLSPAWKRPDDFPESPGEGIPVWTTVVLVLAAVVLEVVVFALASRFSADSVAGTIRDLVRRTATLGG